LVCLNKQMLKKIGRVGPERARVYKVGGAGRQPKAFFLNHNYFFDNWLHPLPLCPRREGLCMPPSQVVPPPSWGWCSPPPWGPSHLVPPPQEQLDFLEDHGLLMRTYLAPTIIDPQAARNPPLPLLSSPAISAWSTPVPQTPSRRHCDIVGARFPVSSSNRFIIWLRC